MPKKNRQQTPLLHQRPKRRRTDIAPKRALEQFAGSGDTPLEIIIKIACESDPTRLGFPWEIASEPSEKERQ